MEPVTKLENFLKVVREIYPKQDVEAGEKEYEDCLRLREIWDDFSSITETQVREIVVTFLNKWKCRLPYECVPDLTVALKKNEKWLRFLRKFSLENTDVSAPIEIENEKTRMFVMIENVADAVQRVKAGRRTVAFTATSKILHMAIPSLFVMCDASIREAYGCACNGAGYANFMIRMNLYAKDLIFQAQGDKQRILDCSKWKGRALTRILDNYNYTTFTLGKGEKTP